jgi:heme O synthase-like polyprenyltransferase
MAELKMVTFDEDSFDLEALKKAAGSHVEVLNRVKKIRRYIRIAKIVIMVSFFIAGYCTYYLANDLIDRYNYNKYHNTAFLE